MIADEAHSSQTGEAAAKLKAVLSPEELEELDDGGEVSTEDILAAQMAARADDSGITYVAFTATPKTKTMELFGTRPDPDAAGRRRTTCPRRSTSTRCGRPSRRSSSSTCCRTTRPTSWPSGWRTTARTTTRRRSSAARRMKGIMGWVRLHPYNIAQKVEIVVEHFREYVAPLLDGKAKAMVVVGSRLEAVRWQLAIDKYIKERGYKIGTLVAFSGEVNDQESGPDPFTETQPRR